MTEQQIDQFLADLHNAVLATVRRDGSPQLTSVWYYYDDGMMYIGFDAGSAKDHNIKRDPRVSICVDGGHADSRTVTIYGTATFVDNSDSRFMDLRKQINLRYCDSEEDANRLQEITDNNPAGKMIAVRPEKILAWDYNG